MRNKQLSACEWNPDKGRAAYEDEQGHGEAVWSVGTGKRSIHLCEDCAELPKFRRLRRRDWIGHKCIGCGCQIGSAGLCGECGCEDDCDIW